MRIQDILLIIASVILITLVVVQSSKDDVQSAFSGEKSELFANQKQRGFDLFLTRVTAGAAFAFIAIAIWTMAS
ncbi:MAG: preprotein translocase subunit SecG [Bacillota bacterium]|jgi:preprotein translocase subunit SecG